MEYVFIILRREVKSLFFPSGKKTLKSRASSILGWLLYIAFAGAVGYGAYWVFNYIRTNLGAMPGLVEAIEVNLLNGISIFVLMMVFLSGIQTTYKAIYESDDIGFLMAQPVPVQAIFLSKFVSSYVTLAAIALGFGFPAWVGYGIAAGRGLGFHLLALLGNGLLLLVPHSLVTFLLLVAMRYLPGRKMKQLFIGTTAVFGVLIVLLSQMLSAQMTKVEDPNLVLEAMGRGMLAKTWYLPSTWTVNAVLGTVPGHELNPLPNALALVVVSLGLSWISVKASRGWFLAGWSGRTEETDAGKRKPVSTRRRARAGKGAPSGTFATVLKKDLKLLFRDPIVWYNLVIAVITLGFFFFNTMRQQGMSESGAPMSELIVFMSVLMGAVSGAQTGGISISREGPSFWIVRGSPVEARSIFAAKFIYALLSPAVLVALSILAVSLTGLILEPLWVPALLGGAMVLAVASLQILLDVYYPDFTLKVEFGSSKSGRGTGKLLTTMFTSMGLVFAFFFLMMLPGTSLPGRLFPGASQDSFTFASRAMVVSLGLGAGLLAAFLGTRRMKKVLTDM